MMEVMSSSDASKSSNQHRKPKAGSVAAAARRTAERARALREKSQKTLDGAQALHVEAAGAHDRVREVEQERDAQAARDPRKHGEGE
jgi:hypothetical protein